MKLSKQLFPAWAGVIPVSFQAIYMGNSVPRMGGGDPKSIIDTSP